MPKSIADILSGNGTAEKIRDHLNKPLAIDHVRTVDTNRGESVVFDGTDADGNTIPMWATSVVERQLAELEEHGHLPGTFKLVEATSQQGNAYFTLVEADRSNG